MKLQIQLILILSFSAFCGGTAFSQWYSVYNSPYNGDSFPSSIVLDNNGNVYVTGTFWTDAVTEDDYLIIKYNTAGDTLWTRHLDGLGGEDEALASTVDKNGNLLVTGQSEEPGNYDYETVKYSPSGALLWSQRFNGPSGGNDRATGIITDDSLNVYVTGSVEINSYEAKNYTIKYNSSGVQQWVSFWAGISVGSTIPTGIAINNFTGNLFITGFVAPAGTPTYSFMLKLDRNGTLLWTRFYGSETNNSVGYSVVCDRNDNSYLTGYTTNGNKDIITLKYNSAGDSQWVRIYANTSNGDDIGRSISLDSTGACYITGESHINIGSVNTETVTIKYSAFGSRQWIEHYNNNNTCCDHIPVSLMTDLMGNIIVSGKSTGGNNFFDYIALKYSSSGTTQWEQRYHFSGSTNDLPSSTAIDAQGNVYITGTLVYSNLETGTLKFLSNPIGIKKIYNDIPGVYKLYQNYPNPFNPVTTIKFDIPNNGDLTVNEIKLTIYDVTGKTVQEIALSVVQNKDEISPGTYKFEFDGSNLSSGIFFYRLSAGDFVQTKKMVLIK